MKDFAISDNAAVQKQLDRLADLPLPRGGLGLDTIREMCARLGNPERDLPPVFHVAGTNGKGSTCAFLRAMLEADGKRVHVHTKPHLVRYNERIRIAGELVSDTELASLLEEVLDASADLTPSFFEVTTAAMFLAFARHPADACVIEVGLGGRFDATNVLGPEVLVACGIASLGVDHDHFLLQPDPTAPSSENKLVRIGFEKAGIAKLGVPLVTQGYADDIAAQISECSHQAGAPLYACDQQWSAQANDTGIAYRDAWGTLDLPLPTIPGAHQAENAALAVAMIRHQNVVEGSEDTFADGIRNASWPARLHELGPGPLTEMLAGRKVILDGGHNPDAARAMAAFLAGAEKPVHAIVGMMAAKDAGQFLEILSPHLASVTGIPIAGHDSLSSEEIAKLAGEHVSEATSAPDMTSAAALLAERTEASGTLLIAGSLYLAGQVLKLNREWPD
ncbi:bifunctional folylpolyglutamate synthase/dihydrofolate synthase [Aurantiacibacter sp. D1-12]|uniref:bifunctional folylpolyglutamate synthase/dihydrofolate synthase n=1 Tax=Aurantiacibacter sp. D1-12 TaxID=2993658 RepID=UPI00237C945F|nr:folylpolyglutamate synthase/dihydrofolate synthase family protein [Aurantiacibacter sp. D1-12]MDE1468391.1 bifunctional folylpolyglutamate synthase/dihydrofolate synthase [Aurantiacibacter sp. D1-12]